MADTMYCLTNLLCFDILLLYYTNRNSAINLLSFSGDLYLSFGISNSFSFCEYNFLVDFEALVFLSVMLLPIKSPVASPVVRNALFEAVSTEFVVDFFAISRSF